MLQKFMEQAAKATGNKKTKDLGESHTFTQNLLREWKSSLGSLSSVIEENETGWSMIWATYSKIHASVDRVYAADDGDVRACTMMLQDDSSTFVQRNVSHASRKALTDAKKDLSTLLERVEKAEKLQKSRFDTARQFEQHGQKIKKATADHPRLVKIRKNLAESAEKLNAVTDELFSELEDIDMRRLSVADRALSAMLDMQLKIFVSNPVQKAVLKGREVCLGRRAIPQGTPRDWHSLRPAKLYIPQQANNLGQYPQSNDLYAPQQPFPTSQPYPHQEQHVPHQQYPLQPGYFMLNPNSPNGGSNYTQPPPYAAPSPGNSLESLPQTSEQALYPPPPPPSSQPYPAPPGHSHPPTPPGSALYPSSIHGQHKPSGHHAPHPGPSPLSHHPPPPGPPLHYPPPPGPPSVHAPSPGSSVHGHGTPSPGHQPPRPGHPPPPPGSPMHGHNPAPTDPMQYGHHPPNSVAHQSPPGGHPSPGHHVPSPGPSLSSHNPSAPPISPLPGHYLPQPPGSPSSPVQTTAPHVGPPRYGHPPPTSDHGHTGFPPPSTGLHPIPHGFRPPSSGGYPHTPQQRPAKSYGPPPPSYGQGQQPSLSHYPPSSGDPSAPPNRPSAHMASPRPPHGRPIGEQPPHIPGHPPSSQQNMPPTSNQQPLSGDKPSLQGYQAQDEQEGFKPDYNAYIEEKPLGLGGYQPSSEQSSSPLDYLPPSVSNVRISDGFKKFGVAKQSPPASHPLPGQQSPGGYAPTNQPPPPPGSLPVSIHGKLTQSGYPVSNQEVSAAYGYPAPSQNLQTPAGYPAAPKFHAAPGNSAGGLYPQNSAPQPSHASPYQQHHWPISSPGQAPYQNFNGRGVSASVENVSREDSEIGVDLTPLAPYSPRS